MERAIYAALAPYGRYEVHFAAPDDVKYVEWDPYLEAPCWVNRKGIWRSYSIGGSWSGLLRVNEVAPSACWCNTSSRCSRRPVSPHTADIAKIRDIDWEGYDLERERKVADFYAEIEAMRAELDRGIVPQGLAMKGISPGDIQAPDGIPLPRGAHGNDRSARKVNMRAAASSARESFRLSVVRQLHSWSLVKHAEGRFEIDGISLEDFRERYSSELDTFHGITVVDESGWHHGLPMRERTLFFDRFIRHRDLDSHCAVLEFRFA